MTETKMSMETYQQGCMRTAGTVREEQDALVWGALCLAGESGEFANWVKKVHWHGHDYDRAKVIDELGDILWYIAATAQHLGISLDEIGQYNLDKLAKRYPQGFSSERSRNREE